MIPAYQFWNCPLYLAPCKDSVLPRPFHIYTISSVHPALKYDVYWCSHKSIFVLWVKSVGTIQCTCTIVWIKLKSISLFKSTYCVYPLTFWTITMRWACTSYNFRAPGYHKSQGRTLKEFPAPFFNIGNPEMSYLNYCNVTLWTVLKQSQLNLTQCNEHP
jgi:hypothetical protein